MPGDFEDWKRKAQDADILDVALRAPVNAQLKKKGREYAGPCPACAGDDRFSVNPSKRVFNCRGAEGGDVIRMVMHCCAVNFVAACEIINGEPPPDAASDTRTDAERQADNERRAAEARAKQEQRDRENDYYRQQERRTSNDIFEHAAPLAGSSADKYLQLRGLTFPPTPAGRVDRLKCTEQLAYYVHIKDEPPRIVHTGPAMVAPIVDRDRKFRGLHFTYLDLNDPKGKLRKEDPTRPGELLDAKKTRGSKLGYHIDLIGGTLPAQLVLGEGIEKTIAAQMGLARTGRDLSATSFWVAVDLGNLAGKALRTIAHPTLKDKAGRTRRIPGPEPDPEDPGIAIPDSVTDLVLIGDRTSDEFTTQCAMARASLRYAKPGRTVRVAWQFEGLDFDDVLRNAPSRASAIYSIALGEIATAIDAAKPFTFTVPHAGPARASAPKVDKTAGRRQPAGPIEPTPATPDLPRDPPADVELSGSSQPPAVAAAAAAPPSASSSTESAQSSQTGESAQKSDGRKGAGRAATARRGGGGSGGDKASQEALDRRLAYFPLTDLGNAERFRERNRGRLMFCAAIGWYWWDGKRWSRQGAEERVKIAEHHCVRSIQDEADAIAGTDADVFMGVKGKKGQEEDIHLSDLLRAWGRASEANSKLTPIAKHAAAYLSVQPIQLDADPFAINVDNGTLVVRRNATGEDPVTFNPHDPNDLITKIAPVVYDVKAARPRFDQFMSEVQPNPTSQRTLQQFKGYSLTGDVSEQKLAAFHGKGKNGKSVFEDVTAFVAGDYCETVPIETFLAEGRGRNAGQATPDLAILPGVRMLRTSEPKKGAQLDEALIKLATGGEPILARHLNRDYFKFYPNFKLTISGNYRPKIVGADEGIWRRIVLVPWTVQISAEKQDKQLAAKLKLEASGILNWMLDGLRDWMENGLSLGEEVEAATAEYRRDSDQLGRFLEACVVQDPESRVQSSVIHAVFNAWSKANALSEWKGRGFSDAMTERGFKKDKSSVVYFLGIRLTKNVGDFVDSEGRVLNAHEQSVGDYEDHGPRRRDEDDDIIV